MENDNGKCKCTKSALVVFHNTFREMWINCKLLLIQCSLNKDREYKYFQAYHNLGKRLNY